MTTTQLVKAQYDAFEKGQKLKKEGKNNLALMFFEQAKLAKKVRRLRTNNQLPV